MMKKVLVITDNTRLYDAIRQIVEERGRPDIEFTFRHSAKRSPMWEHEDFPGGSGALDVKAEVRSIVAEYELVISAHCLQFFPKDLVERVRCVNIHPGYNPLNRGWYPQVFAIINDLPIGATIHEMDEKLDHGAIIVRSLVDKHVWDTSLTIYDRVLERELSLFRENFDAIVGGKYEKIDPEEGGNFFNKSDFERICAIDLDKAGTFRDFYDLMRALSHGEYRNAYFTNKESGEKIYLKLEVFRKSDKQGN
jgi:methionyl-tRNA formyltransferase